MVNSGAISVIAEGGASSSDNGYAVAEAYAYGVHTYLSVTNDGTITVLAKGGHGTSDSTRNRMQSPSPTAYGRMAEVSTKQPLR